MPHIKKASDSVVTIVRREAKSNFEPQLFEQNYNFKVQRSCLLAPAPLGPQRPPDSSKGAVPNSAMAL